MMAAHENYLIQNEVFSNDHALCTHFQYTVITGTQRASHVINKSNCKVEMIYYCKTSTSERGR